MIDRVRRGPEPQYPWGLWSGQGWVTAVQGVDFPATTAPKSFRAYVYGKAKRLGMKATGSVKGQSVTFRMYRDGESTTN